MGGRHVGLGSIATPVAARLSVIVPVPNGGVRWPRPVAGAPSSSARRSGAATFADELHRARGYGASRS